MRIILSILTASAAITSTLAAPALSVPNSPCTISFNGFQLSNFHLNPYTVKDVPNLLAAVADGLPRGLALHRLFDGEAVQDLPDIVPAAVTVSIPSSLYGTNDYIAVGQLKSDDVWSAARKEAPGVLHHLAGTVEKTRLNVLAAYGRPVSVYISMPGFAISPPK